MMNRYDAGELLATVTPFQISLARKEARNILIYPKVDCYATFDNSLKEIFIPAMAWTPVSITVNTFSIRAVKDSGQVYWQAWYI